MASMGDELVQLYSLGPITVNASNIVGTISGAQIGAGTIDPSKMALPTKRVTLSLGAPVNTTGAQAADWTLRFPLMLPVKAIRWRLKIANVHYDGTVRTMPGTLVGVAYGTAATASSRASSSFTTTPTNLPALAGLTVPVDGTELITPWVTDNGTIFDKHTLKMLSLGITTTNSGTGATQSQTYYGYQDWGASGSTRYAATALGGSVGNGSMFDIRFEYEFVGTNPVGLYVGDSITEGYNPDVKPTLVHECFAGAYGLRNDMPWVNAGYFGLSASQGFGTATSRIYTRFDLTTTVPDFAVIDIGSNDVAGSQSAATIQTSLTNAIAAVRTLGVPRIYLATITPRAFAATPEAVRVAVNTWIASIPLGVEGCLDFDKIMRTPGTPASSETDGISSDGVHPNRVGQQRMASMINISVR